MITGLPGILHMPYSKIGNIPIIISMITEMKTKQMLRESFKVFSVE